MARQSGHIKLEGTIGGLCFYRLEGAYYVRRKSSLSRKRVLKDPCFARSRAAAERFGTAVKLAAQVYRRLRPEDKGHGVIGRVTAAANGLLCAGHEREAVLLLLEKQYLPYTDTSRVQSPGRKAISAAERLSRQLCPPVQQRLQLQRFIVGYYAGPVSETVVCPLPRGAPVCV